MDHPQLRGSQRRELGDTAADTLARLEHAAATHKASQQALLDAIVQAGRDGVPQIEVVRATGYSRERIRQLWRQAGIGG